jgi:hypothetical protein
MPANAQTIPKPSVPEFSVKLLTTKSITNQLYNS